MGRISFKDFCWLCCSIFELSLCTPDMITTLMAAAIKGAESVLYYTQFTKLRSHFLRDPPTVSGTICKDYGSRCETIVK